MGSVALLFGALAALPGGAAVPAEPEPLVAEFRLYRGGEDDHRRELVSEFFGRWLYSELPVSVSYNSANEPSGLGTMTALAQATSAWNNVPGHYLRFNQPVSTTVQQTFDPESGCDGVDAIDGHNTVQWSSDWGDSGFLALACLWGGTLVGDDKFRIIEFDIWIRTDAPWSSSGAANTFDLPTVLLHELGHAVGLGHDPDASTVMFDTLDAGQQRRSPTAEDEAGVLHLYAHALRRVIPAMTRE